MQNLKIVITPSTKYLGILSMALKNFFISLMLPIAYLANKHSVCQAVYIVHQ